MILKNSDRFLWLADLSHTGSIKKLIYTCNIELAGLYSPLLKKDHISGDFYYEYTNQLEMVRRNYDTKKRNDLIDQLQFYSDLVKDNKIAELTQEQVEDLVYRLFKYKHAQWELNR